MTAKRLRILLWTLVVLALAGFAFLVLRRPAQPAPQPGSKLELTSLGGPFTLVGSDSSPFSSAKLNGKPYAIFFGFTHCPDVCPTTLSRLVRLRQQLGAGNRPFEIVFVSVDPERDKPADVGAYTTMFNSPIIGLTGSSDQIDQVKKQFGIFSQTVPRGDGNYSVDHTATVLLFDRTGAFAGTISPDEQDPPALAKLNRIAT